MQDTTAPQTKLNGVLMNRLCAAMETANHLTDFKESVAHVIKREIAWHGNLEQAMKVFSNFLTRKWQAGDIRKPELLRWFRSTRVHFDTPYYRNARTEVWAPIRTAEVTTEFMWMFGIPREQSQWPRPDKGKEKQKAEEHPPEEIRGREARQPRKRKEIEILVEDQPPRKQHIRDEEVGAMDVDADSEPEALVSEHFEVEDLMEILTNLGRSRPQQKWKLRRDRAARAEEATSSSNDTRRAERAEAEAQGQGKSPAKEPATHWGDHNTSQSHSSAQSPTRSAPSTPLKPAAQPTAQPQPPPASPTPFAQQP